MLHSAGYMAAICGCAKPVCLSDCLCGSLSPRGVTVCEYVRGGDYYHVCRPLSVPKRLTHVVPHVHTHTQSHSLHSLSYISEAEKYHLYQGHSLLRLQTTLTLSHAYFLSSTVALSGPHQYYMLFIF